MMHKQTFHIVLNDDSVEYIIPQCGDIWMCELPGSSGSVQKGYRPVFILSNNQNNKHSNTINVMPITSKMKRKSLPCHVELEDYEDYGLSEPSMILVEQLTTISKDCLRRKVGCIENTAVLVRICKAMSVQFPVLDAVLR